MKNILKIFTIFSLLLVFTGCSKDEELKNKEVLKVGQMLESMPVKYYTVDDDTVMYTTFDSIKYDDNELKDALDNKKITIDAIISKMELKDGANDGGSKYYQDGNTIVIVCNSLEESGNNHNIYITYKNDNPLKVCSLNTKKIENCITNELNSLISSKKVSSKNGKLTSLTSNTNYEEFTYKKSSLGEFVLIKTEDDGLINDIKTYFKKKNKKYYYSSYVVYSNESYHVFFYNSKNADPSEKISACLSEN